MSAEARTQLDPVERLKRALSGPHRARDFFADYVRELELHRTEEDIFTRLAFRDVSSHAALHGGDLFVTSVYSDWYETLEPEAKLEVRQWWHEKLRSDARRFDNLKTRLANLG
jgi:hypothetical protein